ncbi:MAG: restriction endonuclease [Myxococcota bacterium]|nr:restriction endonuclease [Myxococcota bacterium]
MFILVFLAIIIGFVLIALIGATSPPVEHPDFTSGADHANLFDLSADQLGRIVGLLISKMGLELDRASGGSGGEVEIYAINPTPLTGGKILIHCLPAPSEDGKVNGLRVAQFIRATRSAYVSKGLLFTTGDITPDGRLEAEDSPVELFDRMQLASLIEEHIGELTPELLSEL